MTRRRYWTNRTESDHLTDFAELWLEIYDENEVYNNERLDMLSVLSKLEYQIEQEDPEGISSAFDTLKSSACSLESSVLEDILEPIRESSINSSDFKIQRDNIIEKMDEFLDGFSIIEKVFEEENIDSNPQSFYDRRKSAIERTARDVAKSELETDDAEASVHEVRTQLTSISVKTEYRNEIVDKLEKHLLKEDEMSSSNLRSNIQFLFSELGERGWPRKCLEKTIKIFWNSTYDSKEERVTSFSKRVRDIDSKKTVYIPLPNFPNELSGINFAGVLIEKRNTDPIRFDERFNPDYEKLKEDVEDIDIFAKITVTGDLGQLARIRATENLENVFDALNFGERYPLQTPVEGGIMRFYTEDDAGDIRMLHRKADIGYFDIASRDQVLKKLDDLEELFDRSSESELAIAMKNSMRWHRYAIESSHPSDKFLKFVVALESVLVPKKGERKSPNIKERGVKLLGVLGPYQEEYRQFFDKVYSVRSEIAHNAEYRLSEVDLDLEKLREYCARILGLVGNYIDSCDSIDEVLEKLEADNRKIRDDRISDAPVGPGESFAADAELKQYDPDEEEMVLIGEVQLEGVFKDDGIFVYYDMDAVDFERKIEDGIILNTVYDLMFDYNGTTYEAKDIAFVDGVVSDLDLATEEQSVSIRFYDVDANPEPA